MPIPSVRPTGRRRRGSTSGPAPRAALPGCRAAAPVNPLKGGRGFLVVLSPITSCSAKPPLQSFAAETARPALMSQWGFQTPRGCMKRAGFCLVTSLQRVTCLWDAALTSLGGANVCWPQSWLESRSGRICAWELDLFLFPLPAARHPRLRKGCSLVKKRSEGLFSLSSTEGIPASGNCRVFSIIPLPCVSCSFLTHFNLFLMAPTPLFLIINSKRVDTMGLLQVQVFLITLQ